MKKFRPLLLVLAIALTGAPPLRGQDAFEGIDLLYPEFAHPVADAQAAIESRDFRFIRIDRRKRSVPGLERYPGMRTRYGTKFIRQRFRIFATSSQNFSFNLRARAYAYEYNQTLLKFLLEQHQKK